MGSDAWGSKRQQRAVYLNNTLKDGQNLARWRKAGEDRSIKTEQAKYFYTKH